MHGLLAESKFVQNVAHYGHIELASDKVKDLGIRLEHGFTLYSLHHSAHYLFPVK